MNKMLMHGLTATCALVFAAGISGCNRNADAGVAGYTGMATGATTGSAAVSDAVAGNVVASKVATAPSAQYAKVTSVTPVRQSTKVPKEVCRDEAVTQAAPSRDEHNVVGTAIGAVAGGLLGNQVGGGKGKTLATVAGAVGGGYAGNRIEENRRQAKTTTSVERRCETVQTEGPSKIVGYDVTYVYNGVTRTTRMDHDPGDRVQVQVKENVTAVPVSR